MLVDVGIASVDLASELKEKIHASKLILIEFKGPDDFISPIKNHSDLFFCEYHAKNCNFFNCSNSKVSGKPQIFSISEKIDTIICSNQGFVRIYKLKELILANLKLLRDVLPHNIASIVCHLGFSSSNADDIVYDKKFAAQKSSVNSKCFKGMIDTINAEMHCVKKNMSQSDNSNNEVMVLLLALLQIYIYSLEYKNEFIPMNKFSEILRLPTYPKKIVSGYPDEALLCHLHTPSLSIIGAKIPDASHITNDINAIVTNFYKEHFYQEHLDVGIKHFEYNSKDLLHTNPEKLHIDEHRKIIKVRQGYIRCNTLALDDNTFITSDRGIEKALLKEGMLTFFLNPCNITLKGYKNGFIGGCGGVKNMKGKTTLFLNGDPFLFSEQKVMIEEIMRRLPHINLIYAKGKQLADVGSVLFGHLVI